MLDIRKLFIESRVLFEDDIPGGKADNMTVDDIAKKFDVSVDSVQKQLDKGIDIEFEHTGDKGKAKEISLDHLSEFPDYYDRLDDMEKEAETDWKK